MSVTIKKSPQGDVVIMRGWGFVTASSLMDPVKAVALAARLTYTGRIAK